MTTLSLLKSHAVRKATGIMMLLTGAIWIGWDVFAYTAGPDGSTISELARDGGVKYRGIVFGISGLMGHFWLNRPSGKITNKKKKWGRMGALIGISGLLCIPQVGLFLDSVVSPSISMPILMALGALAGRLLFPLSTPEG